MKLKNFTDYKLISKIMSLYAEDYLQKKDDKTRFYIPIKVDVIAQELKTDGELVFQRLYNHLDNKFSYKKTDNSVVHLFLLEAAGVQHLINYPFLCSVHAGMKETKIKENLAIIVSFVSLAISIITIFVGNK